MLTNSTSYPNTSNTIQAWRCPPCVRTAANVVIDLTLDSDEELPISQDQPIVQPFVHYRPYSPAPILQAIQPQSLQPQSPATLFPPRQIKFENIIYEESRPSPHPLRKWISPLVFSAPPTKKPRKCIAKRTSSTTHVMVDSHWNSV